MLQEDTATIVTLFDSNLIDMNQRKSKLACFHNLLQNVLVDSHFLSFLRLCLSAANKMFFGQYSIKALLMLEETFYFATRQECFCYVAEVI